MAASTPFDIPASVPFGTYRVRQQVPSNRLASTTETKVCVMPDGESCENQDFGSFLSVQISGMTWDDLNGNGLVDGGEPVLDGVTVTVDKNNDGTAEHAVVTSGGSLYAFNIPPGASGVDFGSRVPTTTPPTPPPPEPQGTIKVEPEYRPDKLTQEQRQQKDHTNTANLDVYHTGVGAHWPARRDDAARIPQHAALVET